MLSVRAAARAEVRLCERTIQERPTVVMGRSSKGLFPSFCCDWSLSARKKTGQVLPCPGNSILRLKGNQDSHHTRFALLTFFRADSLRGEAIRLSEKRSGAGSFGLQIRERMPCFGCEGLLKATDQGLIQGVASFVHLFRL